MQPFLSLKHLALGIPQVLIFSSSNTPSIMQLTLKRFSLLLCFVLTTYGLALAQNNTETRNISGFTGIEAGGIFRIILTGTGSESVRLEIDGDIQFSDIETEVKGGILRFQMKNTKYTWRDKVEITAYVTYKELNSLELSGASFLKAEAPISADRFMLQLSGASKVCLDLNCSKLDASLSGASRLILAGKASNSLLTTSGASNFEGADFDSESMKVSASGASNIEVKAVKILSGTASGASNITYYGQADTNISTSGVANIRRRN
ncbi:MAG: DUF2807 domain-containing protein [Cytophagales bacterium]|nr:MAG: DUF2807 domain-containing protein [Cytophagales bacterium]TAF61463.1 MAG: DUF2807 domain-containing protein [Cytophagales bacterium]